MSDDRRIAALRADRAVLVSAIRDAGGEIVNGRVTCPFHDDKTPSGSIWEKDGVYRYTCHSQCNWTGDVFDVVQRANGCTFSEALVKLGIRNGKAESKGTSPKRSTNREVGHPPELCATAEAALRAYRFGAPTETYEYADASGAVVGIVARWDRADGKEIRPVSRHPDGWIQGASPTPRNLYLLPHLLADDRDVILCEGERCANRLRAIGFNATTWPGGSKAARFTDWAPLKGRRVIIWPDHDKPGAKAAREIAGILHSLGCAVRIIDAAALKVPEGGDVIDWEADRGNCTNDDLRQQVEKIMVDAEAWKPPTDEVLKPESPRVPPWRPFPVEALPGPIRRMVVAVAGSTGTDPAGAALCALAVFAGCVGNRVRVVLKSGWNEPAVVWAALVGRPGTNKTAVLRPLLRPLVMLFKRERTKHAAAMNEHAAALERHKAAWSRWREAEKNEVHTDRPVEPVAPVEKRVLLRDITLEKLAVVLSENPMGVLVAPDELGTWAEGLDKYRGGRGGDLSHYLSMHTAEPISVDRKGDGTIFIEHAAVSITGTIPPGALRRTFGAAEREAGALARFWLAWPPELPALWTDTPLDADTANGWQELLDGALSIEPRIGDDDSPVPTSIPMREDAKREFILFQDGIARRVVDTDDEDVASALSKLRGGCARLALLFAVAEAIDQRQKLEAVESVSVRGAVQVAEWIACETVRVFALLAESDEARVSRRLVEWIRRRGGSVTVNELARSGPRRFRGDRDGARAELSKLAESGAGSWNHRGGKAGRPAERFTLAGKWSGNETPRHDSATGGLVSAPPDETGGDPLVDAEPAESMGAELDANGRLFAEPDRPDASAWGRR